MATQLLGTPCPMLVGSKQPCKPMVDRGPKRREPHPVDSKKLFFPRSTEMKDLLLEVNNSSNIGIHKAKTAIFARSCARTAVTNSLKCSKMTINVNKTSRMKLSLQEIITLVRHATMS